MEELKELLRNHIILKEEKKELYYRIKDNHKKFKSFINEKLAYNLIIRGDFIKLEKLPEIPKEWMGITEFENIIEYIMLMLLLVFLEDKGKEDQFLLSHILESLSINDIDEKFNWTDYQTRRSFIKVLKFSVRNKLIKIRDGNEENFIIDTSKEVLFESTGISRYIVRNFNKDILDIESKEELFRETNFNFDKGMVRKNRVYRRLILEPIIYRDESLEDYEYIKNYRKYIEEDFNKYLGWSLHVHKNGTLIVPSNKDNKFDVFPNNKGATDVIIHVIKAIGDRVRSGAIKLNNEDIATINKVDFEQVILEVKMVKSVGWSREFRVMSDGKLIYEVIRELIRFSFIREEKEIIKILPLCGKITGDYPKNFKWEQINEG